MKFLIVLFTVLSLSGCTYQQINAFNSALAGFNSAVNAIQQERALRAYEASVYNPRPQTVVVIHKDDGGR